MRSDRIQRRIEALLDEADQAIAESRWDTVKDRAQNVLALDPDNTEARTFLAAAERAQTVAGPAGPGDSGGKIPGSATTPAGGNSRLSDPVGEAGGKGSPTSFAGGRYEVKRFLGEGGKKLVYLAHDGTLDRDVAFALIKTEGLDEVGRERIRREAQAMGRLGVHPHIVSVFDLGDHDGQPYIVTELMGGGDVEGLIEGAPEHRVSLDTALRVADEVCRGLEFAHSRQIVHRDLKPGNVWLTADGRAKLGDFGLAVATDRARLTQTGLMVGTVSYMPPEQALGGEVTPRSDLYSLGAMLYELVTGRPPFIGDESVAIITQHLNTPPVAPSWHVPDLPSELETLILRLLEKDPAKRPAGAAEVRAALARVTPVVSGLRSVPGPVAERAGNEGDNPVYRRTFVGREAEVKQLQQAFNAALSGQGALLTVVGEPGIGKTALCEQLATYAALRGGKALVGHCYEEGSFTLPYLPFIEAMRSYVLERDPEGLREELGSGASEVARMVSEVRQRIGVDPSPPGVDPDEDRWRLFQAVAGFLRNASAVQPLLLVLEDLHWADRGTLELLLHLSRQLPGARLLVVGTYRDIEVDRSHPLSGTLAELRRSATFGRVLLRGLSPDEVQRMLGGIAGQTISWGFAEAVHRQTEGNPLFIQEVLRYLVEEGYLHRADGRWTRGGDGPPEMFIPEGLRDVIGKRLSRLSSACNRVLSVAAVVGRDFTIETLRLLETTSGEEELVSALEEAVHVGVLEDLSRAGQVRFRFAHAFFRQTLYEEIFTPRRLRLHQEVARALERQYASRPEEHAAELAEHFRHSSDPVDLARAVTYGELAAQRALAVYAYGEAAHHLEQAAMAQEVLDPKDGARRCELLLALAEALMPAGEPQRVFEQVAEEAFALAQAVGDDSRAAQACLLALEALERWGSGNRARHPRFRPWVERLDLHAAAGARPRLEADLLLAALHLYAGRWAEARQLQARALATARQLADAEALFHTGTALGQAMWSARQWPELVSLTQELAGRSRVGVRSHTLALFLQFGSTILFAAGERELQERLRSERVQIGARSQDAELQFSTRGGDATQATLDGDLEGAVAAAEARIGVGEEIGSPARGRIAAFVQVFWPLIWLGRAEEVARFDEGRLRPDFDPSELGVRELWLAHQGRLEEARAQLEVDVKRVELSADTPVRILARFLETAVLVGNRRVAASLAPLLEGVPAMTQPTGAITRSVGGAAHLLGDRAAARGHYERALDWATRLRYRPEIALTRLAIAELLLEGAPGEHAEAQSHLDFAIEEFRTMKMQPSLERALRHKGLLKA